MNFDIVRGGVKFGKYKKIEQTRSNTFDIDCCLVIAAILVFLSGRSISNIDLRISNFYFDIGFLVALILGTKAKQFGIRVISVLSKLSGP
ncbi:hypothetical protein KEH51_25315 [[Brevibacterium] frigoritolerans]|uniref:Uncharacterized protein n=1 Tax=Peribacillus frigoritolerans TaxID=450367 RepID=A0A941FSU9_9BACI|nr:hypothetical protein [Peribacillus frigoritolerans]